MLTSEDMILPSEDTVLTLEDHTFFEENGYVVIHEAVPREDVEAVVELVWEFLGMDPDDPEDWYRAPLRTNGMVEVYQHQALWNVRQHPRIYRIFREILRTGRLWVSMDRACMKPPLHPDHPEYHHPGFIHWDVDTSRLPVPFGVQGVLCLTATGVDEVGSSTCWMHRGLEDWVKTQPPTRDRVPRPHRPNRRVRARRGG